MEEDVGVKAPVTRLRRRLSVEQSEDGGSPAPSTPTKKRGGRLAAKPQLDLIDENAQVSSPRIARRKSLATDTEEKPITPSRRSARIKSNSSIVSETLSVQATDSPRAKRAARRNSQAGSDNEGPVTPLRQTRRTRKDSTSSVEQEISTQVKPLPVAEMVIEEEPENEVQRAVNTTKSSASSIGGEELSPNSARKSKRLLEKRNRRSGSKTEQDTNTVGNENLNVSTNSIGDKESHRSPLNKSAESKESYVNLSKSNVSLLKNKETESKVNLSNHNNSALAAAASNITNDKSNRSRTESCPAVTIPVENDSIHFSDSELSKKTKGKIDNNSSGLNLTDNSLKSDTTLNENNTSQSLLNTSSKRKKKNSQTNVEDMSKPSVDSNALQTRTPKEDKILNEDTATEKSDVTLANMFENAPDNVQVTVYFDDSDTNSTSAENVKKVEHVDSEDQCVPVVKHDFQEKLSPKKLGVNDNIVLLNQEDLSGRNISISEITSNDVNNSCEPMDIDETIHEEILQKSMESLQQSNKSLKLSQHSIIEENNNSKRKTSISGSGINTPEISKDNKRKTSLSKSGITTPDLSKKEKRKTSISNPIVNTPDSSIDTKRKSSISKSGTNTPDLSMNNNDRNPLNTDSIGGTFSHVSKNNRRKSSISSSGTNTPDKSRNEKRQSSISNSTADTPGLSENNSNNKSTLILSQLKDVSSTSENLKSPKLATNEVLSKSDIHEKCNPNKKIFKGNLSLNDVKGTPKQNSLQKLTMQTSTPLNTQQLGAKTKTEEQKQEGTKTNKSNFSAVSAESINNTDFVNDEAEEASDDYESGDSQDEEERQYEEQNEIVERGETLTSDEDISNDTDYEKDSFIVSSDAEDNELLSGSGDDLSTSDNELTMSKKSKMKFNERKLKEQKNASREMFESRHKLNASDKKSPTPKTKKNRMRIDSSLLESDEEMVAKPKKSNRMRLDSTLNESALDNNNRQSDANISQKNKSTRDSISEKTATAEREITVFNETTDNVDPLQVLVKQEPKTPQKDLNMSVVEFTDREEIENVQVAEGVSIMNQTGADPLQAVSDCVDTDSSESEEILQNYDSVLNELNKENATKFNKNNVSLNSGKNLKKNHVEPIIDQLNLTHTKKSKKNKGNVGDASELKIIKAAKEQQESDNEDSSDSIDLQLLFSEDNCGSDDEHKSQQNKTDDDMFIPLKQTPGKTNIRESIGVDTSRQNTTLSESSKHKKNRKSSSGQTESENDQDSLNVCKNVNISLNESGTKKKKKHSLSEPAAEETQDLKIGNDFMNESGTNKKKKHSISEPVDQTDSSNVPKIVNVSMNESSLMKKKKHSISEPAVDETDSSNVSKIVNISMNESGIKKKKKHSLSESAQEETQDILNVSKNVNISLNASGKKKKKKHSISESPVDEAQGAPETVEPELNDSTKKKKKRKSSVSAEPEGNLFFIDTTGTLYYSNGSTENTIEESNPSRTPKSEKKKKKQKLEDSENTIEESNPPITPKSEKKKKKQNLQVSDNTVEESNPPITPKSKKKKKKQKLEALVCDDDSDGAPDEAPYHSEKASEMNLQNTETVGESEDGAKKKHKKKKKKKPGSVFNQTDENIDTKDASNSKKRKRKSSNAENSQGSGDAHESVEIGKHNELYVSNKKRKFKHNEDNNTSGSSESKKSKNNKMKQRDVNFQDTATASEMAETQIKKNKKRKHRDDDGDDKQTMTKVKKDSSFQEVHVPRLPESVLRQLDDKPRKITQPKVMATSNFTVENTRQKRAKPSNYLEESIYLNEKSPLDKKQKRRLKKPKVLPFLPTASISDSGFTTNFKINKLSHTTTFEAEPVGFSREIYLQKQAIKRLGTYDRYKKQMHYKMSKF